MKNLKEEPRKGWLILITFLLAVLIVLQILILTSLRSESDNSEIHSVVLKWPPQEIAAGDVVSGYADSWQSGVDVEIVAVQVWMGNPYGVLWEGDVYVTLNNNGDFVSPDQIIVHYQMDKHEESSEPHQEWFQIGHGDTGFYVNNNQTIWAWYSFKNISEQTVSAGDGQVIIYYIIR
jgi:hypothetical protein